MPTSLLFKAWLIVVPLGRFWQRGYSSIFRLRGWWFGTFSKTLARNVLDANFQHLFVRFLPNTGFLFDFSVFLILHSACPTIPYRSWFLFSAGSSHCPPFRPGLPPAILSWQLGSHSIWPWSSRLPTSLSLWLSGTLSQRSFSSPLRSIRSPSLRIIFAEWKYKYHYGCAFDIHVFFQFSKVVSGLSLEAIVFLPPHLPLLQQLLINRDASTAVTHTEVLRHNEII